MELVQMPIIQSLLDVDFYKLTQGDLFHAHFSRVTARYEMFVRNAEQINWRKYIEPEELKNEIYQLEKLCLTEDEREYLCSLDLFSSKYIEFLSDYPLKPQQDIVVLPDSRVVIEGGFWSSVMLYETFVLSIATELFARNYCRVHNIETEEVRTVANLRLNRKIQTLKEYVSKAPRPFELIEFGTRRRLSRSWQEFVIDQLRPVCERTSNVDLARRYHLKPAGTQAHELYMGMQGIVPIQDSQKEAMELWLQYYGDKLAIALNDTLGTEKFLRDFNKNLAESYVGLRHDSGDPEVWADKMLEMYRNYGIDPKTKMLLFSDGLDIPRAIELHRKYSPYTDVAFGIGTNLTNDSFIPVPNVVVKMTHCNGQPVAKLSNVMSKATCPEATYLQYVQWVAANL